MVSGSGQPQIIRSAVEKHKIPLINLQEQEKYYEKFILLDKNQSLFLFLFLNF